MNLKILNGKYKVLKFKNNTKISSSIFEEQFYSITKTEDEISVVVNDNVNIESDYVENNWKMIKIEGILDFSMVGILYKISKILAENDISIFVISTYNTDYILVKYDCIKKVIKILSDNGYVIL